MSYPSENWATYKYNSEGIRVSKYANYVQYTYILNQDQIAVEYRGNNTIYYTYDVDGSLLSMNYNGNEYFYITNIQGDVIELVDISGNTVARYKYDAWGNIRNIYDSGLGIANINPFRYRSYYYDTESGLYYLQSRYYDPKIGRFISSDGMVGSIGDVHSHNMYAYCANNPVMYVDPSGKVLILTILVSLVFVFSVTALYASSLPEEARPGENITFSGSSTPDPLAFDGEILGYGVEFQHVPQGMTCNLYGVCHEYSEWDIQAKLLGINLISSNDTKTVSVSLSVIYLSFEIDNQNKISSWGGGISLGISGGVTYVGSASASIDIDIVGLIRDLIRGKQDGN